MGGGVQMVKTANLPIRFTIKMFIKSISEKQNTISKKYKFPFYVLSKTIGRAFFRALFKKGIPKVACFDVPF